MQASGVTAGKDATRVARQNRLRRTAYFVRGSLKSDPGAAGFALFCRVGGVAVALVIFDNCRRAGSPATD
jgi:hypothetical protein